MMVEAREEVMIVGLKSPSLGCNCQYHSCCGGEVAPGSLLRIKKCLMPLWNAADGRRFEVVLCVHLANSGRDTCRVGLLRSNIGMVTQNSKAHYQEEHEGQLVQVDRLHRDSTVPTEKRQDDLRRGIAIGILVRPRAHTRAENMTEERFGEYLETNRLLDAPDKVLFSEHYW